MNNETHHNNRYTLSVIDENDKIISLGNNTLEKIDRLTTNFIDKDMLLDYINENLKFDTKIKNVIITYHVNKIIKEARMIFSDKKDILIKNNLIDEIGVFLNSFDNVRSIIMDCGKNKHVMHYLDELIYERENIEKYNFIIDKIKIRMLKDYKLKRSFALIINNYYKKLGKSFLKPFTIYKLNEDEVKNLLVEMGHIKFGVSYNETSDDLLNTLLSNNDYEEISSLYDNNQLYNLETKNIFDGSNDFEGKGRSR